MIKDISRIMLMVLCFGVGFVVFSAAAQANLKEMKKYKESFPDAQLKCIDCHVSALPKKDDGQHEWNDYGKAVNDEAKKEAAADGLPTADTYKKVGAIESFKK